MPRSSRWPKSAPPLVCVVDTSTLIEMKKTSVLKLAEQWSFFQSMTPMLDGGSLAYPRQVAKEMSRIEFPDTPGSWAVGSAARVIYPDPSDEAMAEVLGATPRLTDANADPATEEADPYVVALAYDISQHYADSRVIVVSEDVKDRMPRKESIAKACALLTLEHWQTEEFVQHVRRLDAF